MKIPDKLLSRKFLSVSFVLVTVTLGVALKWVPPDIYANIVVTCLSIYGIANVAQKGLETFKKE